MQPGLASSSGSTLARVAGCAQAQPLSYCQCGTAQLGLGYATPLPEHCSTSVCVCVDDSGLTLLLPFMAEQLMNKHGGGKDRQDGISLFLLVFGSRERHGALQSGAQVHASCTVGQHSQQPHDLVWIAP